MPDAIGTVRRDEPHVQCEVVHTMQRVREIDLRTMICHDCAYLVVGKPLRTYLGRIKPKQSLSDRLAVRWSNDQNLWMALGLVT
jgi:hypothetical protein